MSTRPYQVGDPPKIGLSVREMHKRGETLAWTLQPAKQALARGDLSLLGWEIDEQLKVFRINLDPKSDIVSRTRIGDASSLCKIHRVDCLARQG
jgi:hypothetical protein